MKILRRRMFKIQIYPHTCASLCRYIHLLSCEAYCVPSPYITAQAPTPSELSVNISCTKSLIPLS